MNGQSLTSCGVLQMQYVIHLMIHDTYNRVPGCWSVPKTAPCVNLIQVSALLIDRETGRKVAEIMHKAKTLVTQYLYPDIANRPTHTKKADTAKDWAIVFYCITTT